MEHNSVHSISFLGDCIKVSALHEYIHCSCHFISLDLQEGIGMCSEGAVGQHLSPVGDWAVHMRLDGGSWINGTVS